MPRNGSGVFTLAEAAFVPNTPISSADVNSDFSDIATALTGSLARDGQGGMTAVLPLASTGFVYLADPNTGMKRTGADAQAIFCGAINILEFTTTGATAPLDFTVSGTLTATIVAFTTMTVTTLTVSGHLTMSGTDYFIPTIGTTAQRPGSPTAGMERYNSDLLVPEFYDGASWRQFSLAQPIPGQFQKLAIKVATNTTLTITADAVTVQVPSGLSYNLTSINLTNNMATTGAGGLDAGSIAAATWYAVWLIYAPSTNTKSSLTSLSFTAPTLPTGYTALARYGAVRTATGVAQLLGTWQFGRRAQYVVGLAQTTKCPEIATGVSGNITTPTYTAFAVANFVPSTASEINLTVSTGITTGGVLVAPNGGYGGNTATTNISPVMMNGGGAVAQNQSMLASFILESGNIYYASSSAQVVAAVQGWQDNL